MLVSQAHQISRVTKREVACRSDEGEARRRKVLVRLA